MIASSVRIGDHSIAARDDRQRTVAIGSTPPETVQGQGDLSGNGVTDPDSGDNAVHIRWTIEEILGILKKLGG